MASFHFDVDHKTNTSFHDFSKSLDGGLRSATVEDTDFFLEQVFKKHAIARLHDPPSLY